MVATVRSKTVATGRGGARDVSPAASDDGFPGIGMDRESPLGDTSEHSDAEVDPVARSRARQRRAEQS
jgi:hypothetical protein